MSINKNFNLLNFNSIGNQDGYLTSLEENKNIPFLIKRVYYIYDTAQNIVRGKHAHKNLEQILICINGYCKISCEDKNQRVVFDLNKRNQGLYIKNLVWREMFDFSKDCVLLVLANNYYDESDYIRNYEDFLNLIGNDYN